MMKILQMVDSLKIGGAEQLQLTFAKAVQDQEVELTVIALRNKESAIQQALQEIRIHLVTMEGRTLLDPLRLWKLYKLIRQLKPDVIHAHLTTAIILGSVIGRLLSIPVVATLHNTQLKSKNPIRVWLHRMALRRWSGQVIAVGHSAADSFRKEAAPRPIEVIWNAVPEMPAFSETERAKLRRALVGDTPGKLLINVGRLAAAKGHPDLLTAFREIYRRHPDTRLLLVGDGVLRDEIEAQIERDGLQDGVLLLGMRSDVPLLLSISDLYVSASHWEGLPVSVLEAMASGLPIVATAVGDLPQVVTPETGCILPPHQPDQLAEAVCALLEQPDQLAAMGQQAKARIEDHFSARAWSEKLLNLYRSLI